MELLPLTPTISEVRKDVDGNIDAVKKAIATANKHARDGITKQLATPKHKDGVRNAVTNQIIMDCGTRTCSNIEQIATDNKKDAQWRGPCGKLTTRESCIGAHWCNWRDPTDRTCVAEIDGTCYGEDSQYVKDDGSVEITQYGTMNKPIGLE